MAARRSDIRATDLRQEGIAARELMRMLAVMRADDDEEVVQFSIEGETGLVEAVEAALDQADACADRVAGIKARIEKLKAEIERQEERREAIRAEVASAILGAGIPDGKLRLSCGALIDAKPGVGIDVLVADKAAVPDEFFDTKPATRRELNMGRLREAVAEGRHVPGVYRRNAMPRLTDRRKG